MIGPALRVTRIPAEQTARVQCWQARPDTSLVISEYWSQAAITGPDGTVTVRTRFSLGELLDELDTMMASGWPGYGA